MNLFHIILNFRMTQKSNIKMNAFLDESLITCDHRGGTRNWLCLSQCMVEKVYWKAIIPNEFYQRFTDKTTTTLLFQPKLHQLCDLIRSSGELSRISITIEGQIFCKASITNQPHKSFFFSTRKIGITDASLFGLNEIISGDSEKCISNVLKDVFEENLNKDFPYKSQWNSLEVLSAKIHFENN